MAPSEAEPAEESASEVAADTETMHPVANNESSTEADRSASHAALDRLRQRRRDGD